MYTISLFDYTLTSIVLLLQYRPSVAWKRNNTDRSEEMTNKAIDLLEIASNILASSTPLAANQRRPYVDRWTENNLAETSHAAAKDEDIKNENMLPQVSLLISRRYHFCNPRWLMDVMVL